MSRCYDGDKTLLGVCDKFISVFESYSISTQYYAVGPAIIHCFSNKLAHLTYKLLLQYL